MTVDVAPTLVPAKAEAEVPEPKRGAKRARKEPAPEAVAIGATAATSATQAPKKPKGKAKAEPASSGAEEVSAEEGAEKASEPGSWLIVAKTVRNVLKAHPAGAMHCGSDALPALNARVTEIIQEAIARAVSNSRKTLKSCDF